jgi:nitrite reductase/ring-hydroxylating ferredoxin subunit
MNGGKVLMCHSHGALFRPDDGLCILGPCYGQSLQAIEAVEEDGAISLLPKDAPA